MRNFSEASFSEALGELFTLFVGFLHEKATAKNKASDSSEAFCGRWMGGPNQQ